MMMLQQEVHKAGEYIVVKGEIGDRMYFINRGEVETLGDNDSVIRDLRDGDYFGEIALLLSQPRTASIRAKTDCDLFVLEQSDFKRILKDFPDFARTVLAVARDRYRITASADEIFDAETARYINSLKS